MDLSFARTAGIDTAIVTALPAELAALLSGVAARQASCPTARVQARMVLAGNRGATLLAPAGGAFSALTAEALGRWQAM